jgi:pimeloyl-ACP methyl ester carboxylesterase
MKWRSIAKTTGKICIYASSVLAAVFAASTVVSAWCMIKPNRKKDYDCIGSTRFGKLQPVSLMSSDGLQLHAWVQFSPKATSNRWVLLLHGYRSDREVLHTRRRFFVRRGYHTLLLHFRGHGSSDAARISYGLNERWDVKAAMEFIRSLHPGQPVEIGIDGISMGAAAVAYAVAYEGISPDWVILESCYDNIHQALANRLEQRFLHPFVPIIARPLEFVGEHVFGLPVEDLNPTKALEKIHCPVLVLAGDSEEILRAEDVEHLFKSIPPPKQLVIFPGAAHVDLLLHDPRRFNKAVTGFLSEFSPAPASNTPIAAVASEFKDSKTPERGRKTVAALP